MTVKVDGINGLTFADNSTQNVTALNASNITAGTLGKARMATGSVLQVVQATYSTNVTTGGTTFIDTGLTATITPTSSSNKILVIVCQNGFNVADAATALSIKLLRGATLITYVGGVYNSYINDVNSINLPGAYTCFLDSPATTSATTYKTQFARLGGSGNVQVQAFGSLGDTSTITLMEIAA